MRGTRWTPGTGPAPSQEIDKTPVSGECSISSCRHGRCRRIRRTALSVWPTWPFAPRWSACAHQHSSSGGADAACRAVAAQRCRLRRARHCGLAGPRPAASSERRG